MTFVKMSLSTIFFKNCFDIDGDFRRFVSNHLTLIFTKIQF